MIIIRTLQCLSIGFVPCVTEARRKVTLFAVDKWRLFSCTERKRYVHDVFNLGGKTHLFLCQGLSSPN